MDIKSKKISGIKIVRRLIQIGAFVLVPGLFISIFAALKDIFIALFSGAFDAAALSQQLILAVGTLLLTMVMGRFFCGFLCSFGAMGDLFWFLGKKLRLPRQKVSESADRRLKLVKYALLLGIAALVWTGVVNMDSLWNPWSIFGMYASVKGWPSLTYLASVGGALLLLIMLGSLFIERFFCRYLCPLGAVFSVISRFRLFRIKKPCKQCGPCRACTAACVMRIPMYQGDTVTSGECIDCFHCMEICPRNNISANPTPAVATVMTVGALTGLYYLGNLSAGTASDQLPSSGSETVLPWNQASSETGQYTDGIYTGSAQGFHGDTEVSVTVENGLISGIEVLSYEDDHEFFVKAKDTVISEILAAQSADVDTVSGATFSSKSIINAVANALSTAAGDKQAGSEAGTQEDADGNTSSKASGETGSTASSENGSLNVADGVYTGSGTGLRGATTVSVTVSGGVITGITVESYQDDKQFFSRAEDTVISEILSSQSVEVDTVSGATFSSNGILEAVADALNLDFTNPNSSAQSGGHGGDKGHDFKKN